MSSESIKKPLKEWLSEFYEDTGTVSNLVRNIAFAGIGLIWIFKNSEYSVNSSMLPSQLHKPLFYIIVGLTADLFQYLWRALNIFVHYKIKDVKYIRGQLNDADLEDVTMPEYISIGTWFFFISKVVLIVIAYAYIYQYIIGKL